MHSSRRERGRWVNGEIKFNHASKRPGRQTQGNSNTTQQQTNVLVHTYNHASKLPARAVRGWGYGRGVAHALQALAVRDGKPSTAPANHVPARAAVAAVQEQ